MQRVLIVDDETRILRFTEIALRSHGYEVDTAPSGEAALQMIKATKPDIVVLDLVMPGMHGFDVLQELRTFSDVPVVAFSARGRVSDDALARGASDFLPKPFTVQELLQKIQALLPPER